MKIFSCWIRLSLIFIICFFAVSLSADQFGDFTYTDNGADISITKYTGLGGAVVIPATQARGSAGAATAAASTARACPGSTQSVATDTAIQRVGADTAAACGVVAAEAGNANAAHSDSATRLRTRVRKLLMHQV